MIYTDTVTPELLKVAQQLSASPKLVPFRLVGGTAIALQLGHRRSVDIDFFANEKIGKTEIIGHLKTLFPTGEFVVSEHSVSSEITGVRVELFDEWQTPFLHAPLVEQGIRVASLTDLAALKLDAIVGRREKKDYIDLYVLFKALGANNVLQSFGLYNPHLSMKSILFALEEVNNARDNKSVMPELLIDVSWKEIEKSMLSAARGFIESSPKPIQRRRSRLE